ncbi:hypothetical protein ACF064_01635 [Streptomyces sp. NPDC015492]
MNHRTAAGITDDVARRLQRIKDDARDADAARRKREQLQQGKR